MYIGVFINFTMLMKPNTTRYCFRISISNK